MKHDSVHVALNEKRNRIKKTCSKQWMRSHLALNGKKPIYYVIFTINNIDFFLQKFSCEIVLKCFKALQMSQCRTQNGKSASIIPSLKILSKIVLMAWLKNLIMHISILASQMQRKATLAKSTPARICESFVNLSLNMLSNNDKCALLACTGVRLSDADVP